MYIQNVSVCTDNTSTCANTCGCGAGTLGRFERIHGVKRGGRAGRRQFCSPKFAHVGLSSAPQVQQRNPWMLPIFSLRKGRTRNVPDSSNHSLYLIKMLSSNPEGKRWILVRFTCTHCSPRHEHPPEFSHTTTYSNTTKHNKHNTAQHSTAQHSTAQHSTAQHSTAQHSTRHTEAKRRRDERDEERQKCK